MKRIFTLLGSFIFILALTVSLSACDQLTTENATTTTVMTTESSAETTTTTNDGITYYLAGKFSGYVPNDAAFIMDPVEDKPGWYTITVELTEEVRDVAYDGHYYKVTTGTWNECWGVDAYALQPAPVSPTGGGLGSIWVYENMTLIVLFDANTTTIYDNSMVDVFDNPVIYGDFIAAMGRGTDWSYSPTEALELTDEDEDGIYEGEYTLPAYVGTNEAGYSLAIALSAQYYIGSWGSAWGIAEQYKLNGEAAGMGGTSNLRPSIDTTYHFSYDSSTHLTTVQYDLPAPQLYGDWNNWSLSGETAVALVQSGTDATVYEGIVVLPAYTGTGDGWSFGVVTSMTYYAAWSVWGAGTQYLFNGTAAAMGSVSYLKPAVETAYAFSYDSDTHLTTVQYDLPAPQLYGDWNNWSLSGEQAVVFVPNATDQHLYEATVTINPYEGTGDGWSFGVVTSMTYYAAWSVWGAGTQYLFDGNPAAMGLVSHLKPTAQTTYLFVYDDRTHITTVTIQ